MIASSSSRRALALALVAAVVSSVPREARAEPPGAPPTEEQVELARGLYKEARELYRQGRLKDALDKALEAQKTAGTPVTALEACQLLVESGRLVEAREMVRSIALMPVSPRESDKGRDARQQATALASALDARIPKIAVAERPRGVDVVLDGKSLGPTDPAAWQGVDPGPHTIVVRSEDKTCTTIQINLADGEVRTIDLHDVAASCRPESAAQEPDRSTAAPRPAEARIDVAPAPAVPDGEGGSTSGWKWAGGSAAVFGAVAIGVGGYLALAAKSDYNSVASMCGPDGCLRPAFDVRTNARTKADVATVTMGLGAAVSLGGILMWALSPAAPRVAPAAGRPQVALGIAGVSVLVPMQ